MFASRVVSPVSFLNWPRVRVYLAVSALAYLAAAGILLWNGRQIYALAMIGAPVCAYVVARPRLALYLFIFLFFLPWTVVESARLYYYDIGTVLLILSAVLDALLTGVTAPRFPRLSLNFAMLALALILSAFFGYSLFSGIRPIARLLITFLTFLSVYHLSSKISVLSAVRVFFWLTAAHATVSVFSFVSSAGHVRSFGLLETTMDDFAAMALPIGLGLTLWSETGKSWPYAAGSILVFGGLVATQSRAPILFAMAACLAILYLSYRRSRTMLAEPSLAGSSPDRATASLVRQRLKFVTYLGLLTLVALFLLRSGLLAALFGRFERLLTTTPGDTFRLRLVLWQQAFTIFTAHPIFGIGPGVYRQIEQFMPALRMDPLNYYVRGLSAHNLLLHYLAETGAVGAASLLALYGRQFFLALRTWSGARNRQDNKLAAVLLVIGGYILLTTGFEAAWAWGEMSLVSAFFLALIVRRHETASVAG